MDLNEEITRTLADAARPVSAEHVREQIALRTGQTVRLQTVIETLRVRTKFGGGADVVRDEHSQYRLRAS